MVKIQKNGKDEVNLTTILQLVPLLLDKFLSSSSLSWSPTRPLPVSTDSIFQITQTRTQTLNLWTPETAEHEIRYKPHLSDKIEWSLAGIDSRSTPTFSASRSGVPEYYITLCVIVVDVCYAKQQSGRAVWNLILFLEPEWSRHVGQRLPFGGLDNF